jgi:hypothetical protein
VRYSDTCTGSPVEVDYFAFLFALGCQPISVLFCLNSVVVGSEQRPLKVAEPRIQPSRLGRGGGRIAVQGTSLQRSGAPGLGHHSHLWFLYLARASSRSGTGVELMEGGSAYGERRAQVTVSIPLKSQNHKRSTTGRTLLIVWGFDHSTSDKRQLPAGNILWSVLPSSETREVS